MIVEDENFASSNKKHSRNVPVMKFKTVESGEQQCRLLPNTFYNGQASQKTLQSQKSSALTQSQGLPISKPNPKPSGVPHKKNMHLQIPVHSQYFAGTAQFS